MLNLLRAEFYKLKKSRGILIGLLVAACLALLLYGSLSLIDKINRGELANGTRGVMVYQNGESLEMGRAESMMEQVGVAGVLQQMFSGHFVGLILAVLVNMFVIREFSSGAVKNLVGKGYSRASIFLTKMIAVITLTLLFQIAVTIVTLSMGVPFMGEVFFAADWREVAAYAGFQFMFGVVAAVIFMVIGELTRNLAAGIAVSIGVLIFSTTLTEVLDLVFHGINFQPSRYWVLDLAASCPVTGISSEFLIRGVLVSLIWLLLTAVLGVIHFQKADVK
ncbi:MAG: ABC transporter permease subunit [Lachnospiraceae bacterium]|nr:ABC transporter permease subunit [Lachnospiraceae bacterium]